MADDNTLGAPTEGLGQTVTFGFNVAGKPGSQPRQRGQVRAGVQGQSGGNVTMARGAQIESSGAVDLLMKVGAGLIDTQVKEARTKAYVSGMQRAMTGEAVEDIAANQPAWSRVFGDSDAVEGARAYSAEAKVQEVLLSIENDMPNLRRMDAKGTNEFFVKSVNAALTGHAATDNAIMSAVQRNLPAVMKRHAQQHYAFMQEEAATQEANALAAAGARLQAAGTSVANGEITAQDFEEQQAGFAMLSVPAVGRDPEWVRKQRTSSLILMAEQGQFHALNAMDKLGITSLLHPEQKAAIEKSRQANELQYRAKYGEHYSGWIASLSNLAERPTPGWSGEHMMAAVKAMNDDYKARTGSNTDYFNASAVAAYGEKTTQAIAAMQKKQLEDNQKLIAAAAKARDKQLLEQATESAISQAASNGTITMLQGTTDVTSDQVNKWFIPRAMTVLTNSLSAKPEDFTLITRNADAGYVNQPVADQLSKMVANSVVAGEATHSFMAVYESWRKMNEQSPKAAAAYFKEDHAKFLRFNTAHPGPIDLANPNPLLQQAYLGSFGPLASTTRGKLDKKEVDALIKGTTNNLQEGLKYWRPEWLGGPNRFRPGVAEFIGRMVHPTMEVFATTGSQEDALQAALQIAPQNGLQIFGGYAWQDKKNGPIYDELQRVVGKDKFGLAAPEETAEDFGNAVDSAIEKRGGMSASYAYRHGSAIIVTGFKEGKGVTAVLELSDIAADIVKAQKARRSAPPKVYSDGSKSTWYRFGPEITYTEKPGTPSIYRR